MIIHRLSRLPVNNFFHSNIFFNDHFQKDEFLKRSIVEDESQVPSFTIDRTKPTTILQQSNFLIDCHEEIS
jgi:hypothetical protein